MIVNAPGTAETNFSCDKSAGQSWLFVFKKNMRKKVLHPKFSPFMSFNPMRDVSWYSRNLGFLNSRTETFPAYIYIFGSAFPSLDGLGLKGAAVAGRVQFFWCFSLQGSAKEKDNALIQPWFVEFCEAFLAKVFFLRFPWAIPLQFKNSLKKNGVFKRSTLCASKTMFLQSDTKQKSSKSVFPGYKAELVYTGCDAVELCDSRVENVMPWVSML